MAQSLTYHTLGGNTINIQKKYIKTSWTLAFAKDLTHHIYMGGNTRYIKRNT